MRIRTLLLTTAALLTAASPAAANPLGGQVVGGNAAISGQGTSNVTVNQFSQNAIVNWHTFNVGKGERTQFVQPNATSIILNRVTGGQGPSEILGTIDANGRVFLVNRDGFIFGAGAVINTSGFLATTHDIRNDDFMAGRYNFNLPGRPDASIVNMGTITANNGGFAALVAPGVRNSGTITASLGTVVLGAGNYLTLDMYGDNLIKVSVGGEIAGQVKDVATGETLKSLVTNTGKLSANGGRVELTAAAARQVVDSVINTSGVIEANSVGVRNGQIVLSAATASTKSAGAPTQKVKVSGTLSAAGKQAGTKGGKIVVTGESIEVAGATIDASGRAGGGTVMIGGDWGGGNPNTSLVNNQSAVLDGSAIPTATTVSVDAATTINASAIDSGNGGKVILWSDGLTSFAGTILALGGQQFGDGGFAEVSGKGQLVFSGDVKTGAPNGKAGTLLLDPADFYIVTTLGGSPAGASEMTNTQIQNLLATQNVVIATNNATNPSGQNGDIFVNAPIVWNTAFSLTLEAYRNIVVSYVGVNGKAIQNTGAGDLVLRADSTGTGTGTVNLLAYTFADRIDWSSSTGKVSIYYNPASYSAPTNFATGNGRVATNPSVPNQLTAYMLVNTFADLQNINSNLAGTYALGKDIDPGSPTAFNPLGNFTGILDGFGGTGSNRTISNLTIAPTSPSAWNIGLFATMAIGSDVRNLNLSNVNVVANSNVASGVQYIGPVAGQAAGNITNVHLLSGSVNGLPYNWVIAGGLVGMASGTISDSSSAANTSVATGPNTNRAGGLAGRLDAGGDIVNSSASGIVSGGNFSYVGGLVGEVNFNSGASTIVNSSATGNVFVGEGGRAGGLAGVVQAGSSISGNSTASGTVTALGPNAWIGGLVGWNLGAISNSSATGDLSAGAFNGIMAGGLVGSNSSTGSITGSTATSTIAVGGSTTSSQENNVGGLAGVNRGSITNSFAYGDITGGAHSNFGGLVGRNEQGATIAGSAAGVILSVSDTTQVTAGGLVGFNFGSIDSSYSYVAGTVTGGASSNVFTAGNFGGFVGINDATGTITNSFAYAAVTVGDRNAVGGFAGTNHGTIDGSGAYGLVQGGDNSTGGFVGFNSNSGTITNSFAYGAVAGAGNVGGFVGDNAGQISGSFTGVPQLFSMVTTTSGGTAGGFAGNNSGTITSSQAYADVSGPDNTILGGFVGDNSGQISSSTASGSVTANGPNSVLGGFAGTNSDTIESSAASSSATSNGANSVIGGFVGANGGLIKLSSASGPVTGTSDSYLGGLVGFNVGSVVDSTTSSTVTGSGANNVAGGFVGINFGSIDPSTSSGNVSSGSNSVLGSFAGANGALQYPNGDQFIGTISSDSTGTGTVNGAPGPQVGSQYPTSSSNLPTPPSDSCNNQGSGYCGGTLFNPNGNPNPPPPPPPQDNPDQNVPQTSPLLNIAATLVNDLFVEKKQEEVIKTSTDSTPSGSSSGSPGGSSKGGGQGGGNAGRPPANSVPPVGLGPLPSGMPPLNENRFASNEVVMQLGLEMTPEQVAALARQFGLEVIHSQTFGLLGRTVYRFRIVGGLSVRDAIAAIQSRSRYISVQPSYDFFLGEAAPSAAPRQGDSAQYIVAKLGLVEAHGIATGKNVKIAVIDSEIDAQHPDLKGVIAGNFDALPSADQTPHPHGTGMAGAIGSHQRLLGIAPNANIFGVRAFGVSDAGAQGTSMNIVKGLEWAIQQGAQIINMSFAGPRDPILEQAIRSLKDRGIILIAASGNAGAKSPPLFPAADPSVIAVSATDQEDKTYKNAVRGKHVAIAAPGVDILVPAPEGGYQLTTGTSVAAAHISGVVALMLERNPRLTPNDVRSILAASAKKLPQGRNEIGAGLVDPIQALSKSGPKQAQAH